MKLLNISFYVIKKEEYSFLKYRHKIDATIFSNLKKDVAVLHLKPYDGTFVPDEVNVNERFFKANKSFFHLPFSMCFLARRESPDIILLHGFLFPVQVLLLRLFIKSKTKLIVQHHAEKPFKNRIKHELQKTAYKNLDAYLFASAKLAEDYLAEKIIKDKSKIHEVMEGSTNFSKLDKKSARKSLGLTAEEIFLWVGRLDENKDPFTVVKAMAAYKAAGNLFTLYMLYSTAELEADLKVFVAENNLENTIFLVGNVTHEKLELWFSAADYFIAASHYEGSGIALCEAMSCGCIPVVSRIPSFVSMTDNEKCGHLFEVSDVAGLSNLLMHLNPEDKEAASKLSLEKFKRDLSLDAIGRRIFDIASGLIKV